MTLSSSTDTLINLNNFFPIEYSITVNCSEISLNETIKKIAAFVSRVYATFPQLNEQARKKLRKKGVDIEELDEMPPQAECEQFEKALEEIIVKKLSKERAYCSISLTTNYCPTETFYDLCKSIFQNTRHLGFLFPYKTGTFISLEENKTQLRLSMDFKSSDRL